MNLKTFGIAGTLVALALMIGLVAGTSSVDAKIHEGGSVFITGHDPDYHATAPSCNPTGAQNLLVTAIAYARNGSNEPLLVVLGDDLSSPSSAHRNSIAGLEMVESNYVRMNASDFASADLTREKYSAIFVASDSGGLLAQAELDALNARQGDIRDYVNLGGGLVALAESNGGARLTPDGGHFEFLPVSVSTSGGNHSSVGTTVTAFGAGLGLTDGDVNCNYSHHSFGNDGGMNVVDNNGDGEIMSLAYRGFFGPDGIVTEDKKGKKKLCHKIKDDNPEKTWELINTSNVPHHLEHNDVFPYADGSCPSS